MAGSDKRYRVCCPRPYKGANGENRTHFWPVGMGFAFKQRETGNEGISVQLYTRVLPHDKLVLFLEEPDQADSKKQDELPPPDDDIPF